MKRRERLFEHVDGERERHVALVLDPAAGEHRQADRASSSATAKVHVLYESGAKKYKDADYRVKTVHHGRTSDLLG